MASVGYTKSGLISEAPANQKGSPHPVAVEVTVACVFTQSGTSWRLAWWGRRSGIYTAVYRGSQVRNWVLDEVGLLSSHSSLQSWFFLHDKWFTQSILVLAQELRGSVQS